MSDRAVYVFAILCLGVITCLGCFALFKLWEPDYCQKCEEVFK